MVVRSSIPQSGQIYIYIKYMSKKKEKNPKSGFGFSHFPASVSEECCLFGGGAALLLALLLARHYSQQQGRVEENGHGGKGDAESRLVELASRLATIKVPSEELRVFRHQAAGHGVKEPGEGFLLWGSQVLKPVQRGKKGLSELSLYEAAFAGQGNRPREPRRIRGTRTVTICDDQGERGAMVGQVGLLWLRDEIADREWPPQRFLSPYHGVVRVNGDDGDTAPTRYYLLLDDLCAGLAQPCVLDVKIGTQTYDEEASDDKIRSGCILVLINHIIIFISHTFATPHLIFFT